MPNSPYEQGRAARRSGLPRTDNPFAGGPARASWDEGWRDSDAMLKSLGL